MVLGILNWPDLLVHIRTPMYTSDYKYTPSPGYSPMTPGSNLEYSPRTPGSPLEMGELLLSVLNAYCSFWSSMNICDYFNCQFNV